MTQTILLDTHSWVWIQNGTPNKFSKLELEALEIASMRGALAVSMISIWEISMLESRHRLHLNRPCWDWVMEALATPGQRMIDISIRIAFEASRLPGSIHGDPADRIIAATARDLDALLLTRDGKLLEYAAQGHLNLL